MASPIASNKDVLFAKRFATPLAAAMLSGVLAGSLQVFLIQKLYESFGLRAYESMGRFGLLSISIPYYIALCTCPAIAKRSWRLLLLSFPCGVLIWFISVYLTSFFQGCFGDYEMLVRYGSMDCLEGILLALILLKLFDAKGHSRQILLLGLLAGVCGLALGEINFSFLGVHSEREIQTITVFIYMIESMLLVVLPCCQIER